MSFNSPNERRRFAELRSFRLQESLREIKLEAWKARNSQEWEWISKNQNTKFGKSLLNRIGERGEITNNQFRKIREIIGKKNG